MVISILIVEDHAFTREGLRIAIGMDPIFSVVAEARSGEEALSKLQDRVVDLVIVDIGLPGMDGIETARQIKQLYPHIRIVMLTAHQLREEVFASLAAGADAYCLKSGDPTLLMVALQAAAAGSAYLDPQIAHMVLGQLRVPETLEQPLTSRELSILRLIAEGNNNREIATLLGVSVGTVKAQVQDILVKLSATDRTQAAVKALRKGLL